jgi:hypothetical protein
MGIYGNGRRNGNGQSIPRETRMRMRPSAIDGTAPTRSYAEMEAKDEWKLYMRRELDKDSRLGSYSEEIAFHKEMEQEKKVCNLPTPKS